MPNLWKKTAALVAVGVFDVRLFTPTEFLGKEILTVADAASAQSITFLPGQISTFEIDALKITAETNRVQVETSAPPYVRVADILSKALRDNPKVPSKVAAIGINVHAYYVLESFEARDRLGRKLAPIECWGKWSKELKSAAAFPPTDRRHPGMMSIVMRLPMTEDRLGGWVDVKVEPSMRVKNSPEIFIAVNDHYDLGPEPDEKAHSDNPLSLLDISDTRFDSSLQRADEIISSILEQTR